MSHLGGHFERDTLSMSSTTSICADGGLVVHVFLDPQLIFDWFVEFPSFSFCVIVSSLIEVNSGKDFGSTLEAFAVTDMLA